MPGMTGTDLAHAIREHRPDVAVLILSGYANVEGVAPNSPEGTRLESLLKGLGRDTIIDTGAHGHLLDDQIARLEARGP